MTVVPRRSLVREAGPADVAAIGAALREYLVQTEAEKVEQAVGGRLPASGELPARYREEVEDPAGALAGRRTFVAELDRTVVGVVVLEPHDGSAEVKRLWAAPGVRGRGVGSALLDAAIAAAGPVPVTLTVWEWRTRVIRMYESRGFVRVTSWDERPRLVCMRRGGPRADTA
jgi:ribosomal protein S18 acetylase RimI-like enzyme